MQPDEDSVDIDFSNVFFGGVLTSAKPTSDFKDVSALQPIEKPKSQLFRAKPPKKKTKAALMYDSDSIDLDILASYNSKTFCNGDVNGFVPESDESCSSGIVALMKKPLSNPQVEKKSLQQKVDSQIRNSDVSKAVVENNAFAKMMAIKAKAPNGQEAVNLQDHEVAKKGRQPQSKLRRKSAKDVSEKPDSDSSEFEEDKNSKGKLRGRKKSGRRASGNKENALSTEKAKSSPLLEDIKENSLKEMPIAKTIHQTAGSLVSNNVQVIDVKIEKEDVKEQATNAFKKLMCSSKSKSFPVEPCPPQSKSGSEMSKEQPPCTVSNIMVKELHPDQDVIIQEKSKKKITVGEKPESEDTSKNVATPEPERNPITTRRTSAR